MIRILTPVLFLGSLSRIGRAVVSDAKSMAAEIMPVRNSYPRIRCWAGNGGESKEMLEGSNNSALSSSSWSPSEILDQLSETVCGVCDPRKPPLKTPPDPSVPDDRYHAVLVFPDNAPEFIPLATGLLLTERFRITILRLHFESETRTAENAWMWDEEIRDDAVGKGRGIQERPVTGIPCNHPVRFRDDASYVLDADFSLKEQNRFSAGATTCRGPISLKPFDSCAIQAAPGTSLLLKNYIPLSTKGTLASSTAEQGTLPDVIITDATLVGAMWISEAWGVPAIAVASPSFVPLAVEHDAAWTTGCSQAGSSWLSRLRRLLDQRFHSLSITKAYMEMNKLRIDFGLPPLRRPIDYLGPVAAILMEFAAPGTIPGVDSEKARATFAQTTEHWERIHVTGPLLPPCFPCTIKSKHQQISNLRKAFRDKESSTSSSRKEPKNRTVLVVPPTNPTPVWTRNILQGIFMARESLIRYDDCDWDSLSCQKPVAFNTVWLVREDEEDYFPYIFPGHVEREVCTHIMDCLSNHPGTILAIMPCDKYAAVFETTLDISVICIEPTDRFPLRPEQTPPSATNPRELSSKVLQHLRARQLKEQRHPPTTRKTKDGPESSSRNVGSLTRAVSIIERVAEVHRQHFPWKDVAEMQRVTSQAVKNLTQNVAPNATSMTPPLLEECFDDRQSPYDNFTVLIAWIVVLASGLYTAVHHILSSSRSSSGNFRRSHNPYFLHNHHHAPSSFGSSSSDGLFTRPDLEDAWAALVEWYKEQPNSIQLICESIIVGGSSPTTLTSDMPGMETTSPHNNIAGQIQRRRKKR